MRTIVSSLVLAFGAQLTACSDPPPPPEVYLTSDQATEIETLLNHAREAAQRHEDAVRLAITNASSSVAPGEAPCAVAIPELARIGPVTDLALAPGEMVAARRVSRFLGPEENRIHDLPGPSMQSVDGLSLWSRRATDPITSGTADQLLAQARHEIRAGEPQHELVLLADQVVMPHLEGDGFVGGALAGRLFLLDASQQILCVADVATHSGSSVGTFDPAHEGGIVLDLIARGVLVGYPLLRVATSTSIPAAGPTP